FESRHLHHTSMGIVYPDRPLLGSNPEALAKEGRLPSQAGSEQTNNGNLKDFDGELSRTVSATSQETEEANWEDLSHQVEELKSKMGSATDVNMYSIDQLKELEERFKFLSEQEADLNKSKESLQELIRKLNRTSREMFQITFDQIHNNFNILFRKLFGGGKAQLILENENGSDVLDAGIEIIAKPPGKEPSSISLLSGGEKTLTALALVMSIFQLNPSPFCILDEADATLDETNVDRFVALVKQFTGNSQFIIITHNKKTMLAADVLYGLTMQTSGISKKISVKMSDDAPITMG
ncbi:MAG: AAA family ATPase, partial [Planctomycetes bacterium]|nr:AAA family ATPase [Planctomycetota bacterium]